MYGHVSILCLHMLPFVNGYQHSDIETTIREMLNGCLKSYTWSGTSFLQFSSVKFSSVTQSCPTLWNPMNFSTPGLPVHHKLPEFTQTQAHRVGDAIQPSHPLLSLSPPIPNPSQHQGLFQWVNSSHEVARILEFQLQHQSFQWTPRTCLQ